MFACVCVCACVHTCVHVFIRVSERASVYVCISFMLYTFFAESSRILMQRLKHAFLGKCNYLLHNKNRVFAMLSALFDSFAISTIL